MYALCTHLCVCMRCVQLNKRDRVPQTHVCHAGISVYLKRDQSSLRIAFVSAPIIRSSFSRKRAEARATQATSHTRPSG